MSEGATNHPPAQSDALLWLGGAVVVGLGVTWLLMSRPWLGGEIDLEPPVTTADATSFTPATLAPLGGGSTANSRQAARADVETPLEDNPLRMAELAHEAGMLMEPEEYSAWTLYRQALGKDPGSDAARRGLATIADEALKRAAVAVEQGRFDDALATIQRVRSAIPAHPDANDLAIRIDTLRPKPAPPPQTEQPREEPPARTEPAAVQTESDSAPDDEPPVDPLIAPHQRFAEALAANRLLTPIGASARHALETMIGLDPAHELTLDAMTRFSAALLTRADTAIIELDAPAAETWLDEAERLDVNAAAVAAARDRLRRRLIDAEAARRVPVSALVIEHYVPPTFPARAIDRALEGWVDLEFTVGRDGAAHDVVVTDASHATLFRREATEAIAQWRLQPRVYLGEVIEQRAYTRVRFTFNE